LVYRTALRQVSGDVHKAEEATQAVFILLARKASALTGHANLAGWLYTTTGNVVGNMLRAEWRRKTHEQEAVMNEITNDASTEANWENVRPVLDDALGKLGEKERAAIVLRFFEGRGFSEIGAVLKFSEDAARMRTGRALEKLRGLLMKKGITSTVAALGVMLTTEGVQAAPVGLAPIVVSAALAGGSTSVALGFLGFMSTAKVSCANHHVG
jgi:RNA polymerase sigma factor (sigma-70 family)